MFWIVVIASVTTVATGLALVYEDFADVQCDPFATTASYVSTDVFVMGVVAILMTFASLLHLTNSLSSRD